MANSRQYYPSQDESTSPTSVRSREWEGPSRWTEYLGPEMAASVSSRSSKHTSSDGHVQSSGGSTKALNIQWVVQMIEVAEGLMAKMYRLNQILEYPDPVGHVFSEAFWKAGVFPNQPRICTLLSKKFPEHFSKLQLERVSNEFFCIRPSMCIVALIARNMLIFSFLQHVSRLTNFHWIACTMVLNFTYRA